jgi:hypothetical protein
LLTPRASCPSTAPLPKKLAESALCTKTQTGKRLIASSVESNSSHTRYRAGTVSASFGLHHQSVEDEYDRKRRALKQVALVTGASRGIGAAIAAPAARTAPMPRLPSN